MAKFIRQLSHDVTTASAPESSTCRILISKARLRSGAARSISMTPAPPPQQYCVLPCDPISRSSTPSAFSATRGSSITPPSLPILHGS